MQPRLGDESSLQKRVDEWVDKVLPDDKDPVLRAMRFLEEATELCQAAGLSQAQAQKTMKMVYSKPPGEIHQELGGVQTTLCALATALDWDLETVTKVELERMWRKAETIQQKNRSKPRP